MPSALQMDQLSNHGLVFSTSGDVPFAPFVASSSIGSISTGFSLSSSGLLEWRNENFDNQVARFCGTSNPTAIIAVFKGDLPSGCMAVGLIAAPSKATFQCQFMVNLRSFAKLG